MNTIQIERFLKKDPYARKIFKKACARDQLKRVTYPSAYIINTHPSSLPGKHWIARYFYENSKGKYFDIYGLSPQLHRFTDLMDRNSKR